jgi:hypothetical protein
LRGWQKGLLESGACVPDPGYYNFDTATAQSVVDQFHEHEQVYGAAAQAKHEMGRNVSQELL